MNVSSSAPDRPTVGLFVTCLVDLFRPSVGFAAAKLIEAAGCSVDVPMAQTCCGQPAYTSGDKADARDIAENTIIAFEGFDYVVAPSGSCAGMLKNQYPGLFKGDARWEARAQAFAAKVHELVSFLVDVREVKAVDAALAGSVTYHDSCSGLRELGIRKQPRQLLASVEGLDLIELPDADVCCGFGGASCAKYPDLSKRIAERKTAKIGASGAETLLAGDLGCLIGMAGRLKRQGSPIAVRHVAEVLAGMTEQPPIAGGR